MKFALFAYLMTALLAAPGQIVTEEDIRTNGIDSFFSVNDIPDDIFQMMQGKSYKQECTVPRDSLKYLLCLHKDLTGRSIVGEMVVGNRIAYKMLVILKELYLASYPIEKMRLVDYWDADDEKSMAANNSSSFNFRFISNSTRVSKHGLGLAVDINPLYNPYVYTLKNGKKVIEPESAAQYTDRTAEFPYMIKPDDLCCRLFKKHGFVWGGDWKTRKDYQHFELHTRE